MSHAFTRTHSTRSSQSSSRTAWATLARAATFSLGATESSRSRKEKSVVAVGALARNRSDEPGVERQERRGSARERFDMRRAYSRAQTVRTRPRNYAAVSARFTTLDQVIENFVRFRVCTVTVVTGSLDRVTDVVRFAPPTLRPARELRRFRWMFSILAVVAVCLGTVTFSPRISRRPRRWVPTAPGRTSSSSRSTASAPRSTTSARSTTSPRSNWTRSPARSRTPRPKSRSSRRTSRRATRSFAPRRSSPT